MSEIKYKIEKGVPIPKKKTPNSHKTSLSITLRSLEIGDSVFLPKVNRERGGSILVYYKKHTGFGYTLRTVEGGIRVWRTE